LLKKMKRMDVPLRGKTAAKAAGPAFRPAEVSQGRSEKAC
jgi:hypothetical protein